MFPVPKYKAFEVWLHCAPAFRVRVSSHSSRIRAGRIARGLNQRHPVGAGGRYTVRQARPV